MKPPQAVGTAADALRSPRTTGAILAKPSGNFHPPIDQEHLPCDVIRQGRGQEQGRPHDILRLAEPAKRRCPHHALGDIR